MPTDPTQSQYFTLMMPLPPEVFGFMLGVIALFLVYYIYKLVVSLLPI